MSDKGQQEPSMEEILASIRRIISEDGEPTKAEAAPPPPPPSQPPPPPPPPPAPEEDDILELTQMVRDDGSVVDVDEPEHDPDPWRDEPAFPEPLAEPEPDFHEPEPEPPPPPRPAPRRPIPSFDEFDDDEPPPPPRRPRAPEIDDGLISRRVAEESSHHFTHLARQLGDDLSIGPMPVGIRTVEEVVRELLKPLLKEWLDENLPTIVERLVQQEIDRMIRRSQKF